MDLKKLYQERLLDHYNHPRHKTVLARTDFSSGVFNPSCGDAVTLEGTITNNILTHARFTAQGCVISCAAASLLLEACVDKNLTEIESLTPAYMQELVAIPLGPTRLRCALLALEALHNGLATYRKSV